MQLYVDIGTGNIVQSATFNRALDSLTLKRGDNLSAGVIFLTDGVQTDLGVGALGEIGVKAAGDFGGDFLAFASSWTKTGAGTTALYTFQLNMNTTELAAAFGGTQEPSDIPAVLEIQWIVGSVITSTMTLAVDIENDVIQGDEGVPVGGTPTYPLPGALPVIVALPANGADASMFGGTFPATGFYIAAALNALWIYVGGQPGWQVLPLANP